MTRKRGLTMLVTIAMGILLFDQVTKALVRESLSPGESIPLLDGLLHITHVRNTGAAFGMLSGRQWVFVLVAIGVVAGVGVYYRMAGPTSRTVLTSLGLVTGGAVGNMIDRVLVGQVTDFVDPRVFPVFNVADSAIVVGVGLLFVWILFFEGKAATDAVQEG